MFNVKNDKNNKLIIEYKTVNSVKRVDNKFKKLIVKENNNSVPIFKCLAYNYSNGKKSFDYFLNTVLQLEDSFIDSLKFPELVFYDIETDRGADDLKNSEVNSIAWIGDDNEEYCLIKGVDGSEKEIIEQFIEYCKENNIMGLVGHNSYWFDNKIMVNRCKQYKINYNIFYNHCNLDTMILASFLQFTNNKYTGLNDLADTLEIEENKTDTGVYNPITLYNEAVKEYEDDNEEKIKLFREYNMQDVRLCKTCFEKMNVKEQLTELFKQSRCPFNKIQYNTVLLNYYTCKYLHSRNIKLTESVNTEIEFKNKGGYNYYRESDDLQVYNNVLVADIVSYYPHLLMLINADPYNQYENINRETGEIKPFRKSDKVGLICELSKGLYESRAKTKKEMEQTENQELRQQLNYEQLTKKIIVNSLYGLLNQNNGNYILKNDLIAATITKMGRDILQHIVKKYGAVYAKTDSVFISLEKDDEPEFIINTLNIEVSKFIKDKYDLNNVTSNGKLIRFEEDSITDKLVLKDKNNYVKIDNNEYKFKGGDFNSSTLSDFEKDNIKTILKHIDLLEAGESLKLKDILIENTKTTLKDVSDVKYFSKSKKLSEDQKNQRIIKEGIKYMENEDLPYSYGFPYLYCGVEDDKYDYIMFPKGYNPDLKINPVFVYDLLFKQMKKLKIINNKTKKELDKKYDIKSLNNKNEQVKDKYITNKDSVNWNNYNESIKIDKKGNSSYSKLYREIGDKIKELTIMQLKWNSKKPTKSNIAWQKLTETNIKALKKHKGNIGIVFNPESKYKYGFIDIDGFKKDLNEKENKEFKKDLYNLLKSNKNLYEHSIIQKTQSGGYHFIFKHNETNIINNRYMNGFKIPEELKEKYNLQNHDKIGEKAESGAIEIFINMKKYCVVYPSKIKPDKSYEIIHVGKEFGKPLKNIKKQLQKLFGYNKETTKKYKDKNKVKKENNIKKDDKLKKEFLEDRELFNLLCEEFKEQAGHHNESLRVFTAILKFIDLTDTEVINYMDKVLTAADDNTPEHSNQVISYIDSNDGTKPNFKKYLNNKELNNKLDTYINSTVNLTGVENNKINNINIDNEIIELKDSRNETELYNTKEGSFAEYRGKILYSISPEFLYCMSLELKELHKLCSNYKEKIQDKELGLIEMVTGGFYHYGLLDDDIRKILNATSIPEFKEYAKLDNLIIKFGYGNIVYGFKHLFDNCTEICKLSSDGKNNQNQQANRIYHNIKSLLYKATILNPYFYVTGKNNEYKQTEKQFKFKNETYINCAFTKIIEHTSIGAPENIILSKKYDFTLTLKNGRNKKLENYTKKDLEIFLKENNLLMNKSDTTIFNSLRGFINEIKNKRRTDIKQVKKAYVTGFVIKQVKENHYKLFDNFPNLDKNIIEKYTLKDGIELLNLIYEKVYEKDIRFIKIFKWFLVHILREIFKEFNLFNSTLYQIVLYGYGGTGKSLSFLLMNQMFTSEILIDNAEADTIASVDRTIGKSTLPLILDDPVTPLKDYDKISKKYNFGIHTKAKAKDQYGNEVNITQVTRQTALIVNDSVIDNSDSGLARRRYFLSYTEEDKFLDNAKNTLREITYTFGSNKSILKLNSIGINFIQYLSEYIDSLSIDNYHEEFDKISITKGAYVVNNFINYCNSKSNIKLHEDFISKDSYTFETIEIDYKNLFHERFIYYVRAGDKTINILKYNEEDLSKILNNAGSIIKKEKNKQTNEYKIVILWNGLKNFLESPAGLKQKFSPEEFCKILELPEDKKYKFTTGSLYGKTTRNILKISISDFYYYFLDSYQG